jgi:hypothetical protein
MMICLNRANNKFRLSAAFLAAAFATCIPVCSAGILDSLTTGLKSVFDTSKQKIEKYKNVADKQLVDQFYYLSDDGKEEGLNKDFAQNAKGFELQQLSPTSLTLKRLMYRNSNMGSVVQYMRSYNYSPLDDEIGKRYVAFASSRGNVVKLYKPELGGKINTILAQYFYMPHDNKSTIEWVGLDNALVEYSPDGQIVSVMTKSHQAVISFGADTTQYTNIYFGAGNARVLENQLGNNEFENNFLRVVNSSRNIQAVAQPATHQEIIAPALVVAPPQAVPPQPIAKEVQLSTPSPSAASTSTTPEQRIQLLKNLAELKKEGVLTDQEFQVEKQKVLGN